MTVYGSYLHAYCLLLSIIMLSLDELQAEESQADVRWRVDVQAEGICQVRCLASWRQQASPQAAQVA